MNDSIKELILNNQEQAKEIKKTREEKENKDVEELLSRAKNKTPDFISFLLKMIILGVIESKKRYYGGRYNESDKDIKYSSPNPYKEIVYTSDYCMTSVSWSDYFTKEPIISIELNSFDINSIDFISNFTDNGPLLYYMQSFKETTPRDTIKALIKYNRKNSKSQIIVLPGGWKNELSSIDFCLLQLDELEKFGINVGITSKRTIEMEIPISKLENTINLLLNDKLTNNIFNKENIEPLASLFYKFLTRRQIESKLEGICHSNFELISLQVYKLLIESYKSCYDVYRDKELIASIKVNKRMEDEDQLYQDYKLTCPHNKEQKKVVYVCYKGDENDKLPVQEKYIPVLEEDLDNLAKELHAKLVQDENTIAFYVNSIKFENMLINFQDEDNETKTK